MPNPTSVPAPLPAPFRPHRAEWRLALLHVAVVLVMVRGGQVALLHLTGDWSSHAAYWIGNYLDTLLPLALVALLWFADPRGAGFAETLALRRSVRTRVWRCFVLAIGLEICVLWLSATAPDEDVQGKLYMVKVWWLGAPVVVILGPIVEELLCRGYLFDRLRRLLGGTAAPVILSSAVFGVLHIGSSPSQALSPFIFGLVLGLLRARCGSVLPCIALHAAWNGVIFAAAVVLAPYAGL